VTEIQQNRYDQLVRRVANIVAPGSMVNDTLNELFPTLDVENLPPELYILSGTSLAFGGGSVGPTAAQGSKMQLFNPVGSGQIITVTRALVSHATGLSTVRWGVTGVALASGFATQIFQDTRKGIGADGIPVGGIFAQTSVALAPATGSVTFPADTPFYLENPDGLAVLAPGTGLDIGLGTVNIAITVTFWWRERAAEPAELNI